jgi:hypothetical protein
MMADRVARILSAVAVALALVSLGLSGYLWTASQRYVREAGQLREALSALRRAQPPLPMRGPPPELEFDDE